MAKMKKPYTKALVTKLAKEHASLLNYIGLDTPSDTYSGIEDIVRSIHDVNEYEKVKKQILAMTYKDVLALEREVNKLIETGKYD
jgi:hypothetical protein